MAYFNSEETLSVANIPNNFRNWQIFSHLSSSFPDGLCTFIKPSPRWFFFGGVLRRTKPKISLFWKQAQHTNGRPKKTRRYFSKRTQRSAFSTMSQGQNRVSMCGRQCGWWRTKRAGWVAFLASWGSWEIEGNLSLSENGKNDLSRWGVNSPSPSPGRWQQGLTPHYKFVTMALIWCLLRTT